LVLACGYGVGVLHAVDVLEGVHWGL